MSDLPPPRGAQADTQAGTQAGTGKEHGGEPDAGTPGAGAGMDAGMGRNPATMPEGAPPGGTASAPPSGDGADTAPEENPGATPSAPAITRGENAPDAATLEAAIIGTAPAPARIAAPLVAMSPAERLAKQPTRFDLDQAALVAGRGRDPVSLPYRAVLRLGLPAGEVMEGDVESGSLTVPTFGLLGPGGALPRHYTATAAIEQRQLPPSLRRRGAALVGFMEMLSRRFTGMWVKAGAKYRPARNPKPIETALAGAVGMATPGLDERLVTPQSSLLYHAGHLASRTRGAARLQALLEAEIGRPVEIVEFTGGWQRLPPEERSMLGRSNGRLGMDAAAGAQIWDPASRFTIRVGPMDQASFERLLPGAPQFARLTDLVRLHVGLEHDFVLNPVLAAHTVPSASLGRPGAKGGGTRLGRTSWLHSPSPRRRDAAEARLRPAD